MMVWQQDCSSESSWSVRVWVSAALSSDTKDSSSDASMGGFWVRERDQQNFLE